MRLCLRLLPLVLALALLAGCGEPSPVAAPAPDCSAAAQWRAGLNGAPAAPACDSAEAREAHLLGSELRALQSEYEQIDEALRTDPDSDDAGARQRRQRQLQVDMEAIESEARVRGWVAAGPG